MFRIALSLILGLLIASPTLVQIQPPPYYNTVAELEAQRDIQVAKWDAAHDTHQYNELMALVKKNEMLLFWDNHSAAINALPTLDQIWLLTALNVALDSYDDLIADYGFNQTPETDCEYWYNSAESHIINLNNDLADIPVGIPWANHLLDLVEMAVGQFEDEVLLQGAASGDVIQHCEFTMSEISRLLGLGGPGGGGPPPPGP